MRPLRLARLLDSGEIAVESVDLDLDSLSDESFRDVGVCSYTWGFERETWADAETGLSWEVSTRALPMARAALAKFPRVWIDGLCMVQAWPEHIGLNMKHMGKIYYHGTVVPELMIDVAFHYSLCGWVQQELSFTNLTYAVRPLAKWMKDNAEAVAVVRAGEHKDDGKLIPPMELTPFVVASFPYINTIIRATEGRSKPEARQLSAKLNGLLTKLQQEEFMYGSFGAATVEYLVKEEVPLEGQLEREMDETEVLYGALQAYRTGFFRFNSDRKMAAFSLAQYVTGMSEAEMMAKLDALPPPEPRRYVTVNANPGRWCTGLAPVCDLHSVALPYSEAVQASVKVDREAIESFASGEARRDIDLLVSVLYDVPAERMAGAQYVAGYKLVKDSQGKSFFSCHFGYRPGPDSQHCHALVSAMIEAPAEDNASRTALSFANSQYKMELGSKIFGLSNASYTVHSMEEEAKAKATLKITTSAIRMLDMYSAPPFGDFLSPMRKATWNIMHGLGIAALLAAHEKRSGDVASCTEAWAWGAPTYEHHEVGGGAGGGV